MPITILQREKGYTEAGKIKRKHTMGMSVSTSMELENWEMYRNPARQNAEQDEMAEEKAVSKSPIKSANGTKDSILPQQYVLQSASQITLNNSLKETLKYLSRHAYDKKKVYKFGDLWKMLNDEKEDENASDENSELLNFEIDENAKNIFAA